ncbi:hypothetical protein AcV5_000895 [Taiwanofungus camphoratus]|nr:hypothetical protein AcW2_006483 [Antrodia cinnamomea]KAI0939491.1 hypothetical protein AcV5_000895 [Antrodia cinnamomea]KAI0952410.1 hypothetical protein AcV7_008225 [Antrodia cinnamomea]
MSRCPLRRIGLLKHVYPSPLSRAHRMHTSAPCRSAFVLPNSDVWNVTLNSTDPKDIVLSHKFRQLKDTLAQTTPHPNRVWGRYIDMLNFLGFEKLPLDIHQSVLRKCTPSAAELRVFIATRSVEGVRRRDHQEAHIYEYRFQAIIRNIRSSGWTPDIDDYHFILEQFAAAGHHQGSMHVLEEITLLGLPKSAKTYGLCLQALCHRLTLPCRKVLRPQLVSDVTRLCLRLVNEMNARNVPFTSVNVDLVIRILKETSNLEGFQNLMKVAYGIDLSYPDRPPLEHWDRDNDRVANFIISGGPTARFPDPLPFSTDALNTTIDMLGRLGNVSKLIQTFEVLTTPLSMHHREPSSFDDDDDDDYGLSNPRVAPYQPPHARPNTQSYHMLLKWLSRAGHTVLARHYLLQAISVEKADAHRLRIDCIRKAPAEIVAPQVGVNRSMLLAVYAQANRDKDLELMRWVLQRIGIVIRRKRGYIKYHTRVQARWQDATSQSAATFSEVPHAEDGSSNSQPNTMSKDVVGDPSFSLDPAFSTFFSPSSASGSDVSETINLPPTPYFDVDLDATPPSTAPPPKQFDIGLHLSILKRDLEALEHLEQYVADMLGRTTQRVKERLGRRVWAGKNIYMRDLNRRVAVSREEWRQKVQYRPRMTNKSQNSFKEMAPHLRAGQVATTRGLATSSVGSDAWGHVGSVRGDA